VLPAARRSGDHQPGRRAPVRQRPRARYAVRGAVLMAVADGGNESAVSRCAAGPLPPPRRSGRRYPPGQRPSRVRWRLGRRRRLYGATGGGVDALRRRLGRIPPLWVLSSDSRGDLAEALARDEAAARAEWLAEWRRDVDAFVAREVLDACIVPKRQELPP